MTAGSRKPRAARVLLRLPADLHRSLTRAAAAAGLSFNEFCVRRLAGASLASAADRWDAARTAIVARAQETVGEALVGVIALGSWARGEAGPGSDIDVLVVVDRRVELTRDLYRYWDRRPLALEGRPVDAHFVHLPADAGLPGAVWCEAAVDGLVWYDLRGDVTTALISARRAIAEGRVVRAFAHGQPYWKGAA